MHSADIERALAVAIEAHAGQQRKGADRQPYVVHPMQVGLMLARLGHDHEVVQAGILHDVVEDCDGWTIERITIEFGARVGGIVDELTEDKSLSWAERKQGWIDAVPLLSREAASAKACDKLHNLASLADELERAADTAQVWARFHGGRDETLRMSAGLVEALAERVERELAYALLDAYQRVLAAAD
jgi:myo-inositol-1(or 4)-monophosphatase